MDFAHVGEAWLTRVTTGRRLVDRDGGEGQPDPDRAGRPARRPELTTAPLSVTALDRCLVRSLSSVSADLSFRVTAPAGSLWIIVPIAGGDQVDAQRQTSVGVPREAAVLRRLELG